MGALDRGLARLGISRRPRLSGIAVQLLGSHRLRLGLAGQSMKVVWYVVQSAIVAGIVLIDAQQPEPRPGLAILVGIGYALTVTVVVALIREWIISARLRIVALARRIRDRRDKRRRYANGTPRGPDRREHPVREITLNGSRHPHPPRAPRSQFDRKPDT